MANSRRKNQETRVSEDVRSKASDTATKPFQDGDVRAAILELIGTDEDVMKSIVDSVSQVIVTKLLSNDSFIAKLADGLMKDGVLDAVQNVYDACALDDEKISSTVESLERRVGDLDNDNRALREELDTMEQYSRRNCMFSTANQRARHASQHRPQSSPRPLSTIVEQATTRYREVRLLRDPPASVLGEAPTQGHQGRHNGKPDEA